MHNISEQKWLKKGAEFKGRGGAGHTRLSLRDRDEAELSVVTEEALL